MFAASKTTSPSGGVPDPQFNYVTMLLHGDGTNGAQNNTFLDSSTNNYTITRTGNTTQGSFSPYGSNWCNYFDGSGDYLEASANSFSTSGTWTIEAWVYLTSDINYDYIVCGLASDRLYIQWAGTNFLVGDAIANNIVVNNNKPLNQWLHVAVVKNGSTYTAYFNGVSVGSSTTALTSTTLTTWQIGGRSSNGGYTKGYISNLRIVTSAVYTSNFTPSTAPLTAISGTQLLTCQSNRFIDNSTNNFAITKYGDTSVQRFNPFGASTAYSTSVIGGSAYFDGSGDNLKFPANSGLLGSNDFSFEAWVYPITLSSIAVVSMGQSDLGTATGSSYGFYVSPSGDTSDLFVGGTTYSATSPNPKIGAWNHVAYVRTGSTFSTYLNGVRVGTTSVSGSLNNGDTTYPATLGGFSNGPVGRPFNGYIAGYQRIIGSGGYNATSTTITVPTTPPTAVANTNALLNFTNGAIFDNAMMNNLETVGNAQISTSVVKYGTGSLKFDGTGDWLACTAIPNLILGSGDFTIECWVYISSYTNYGIFCGQWNTTATQAWAFRQSATTGKLSFVFNPGEITVTSSGAIGTGAWAHIAVTRSGSTFRLFINGTLDGSTTSSTTITSTSNYFSVGGTGGANPDAMNGYVDDLRITKGYARYTASFTAPTAAFPNTGPV